MIVENYFFLFKFIVVLIFTKYLKINLKNTREDFEVNWKNGGWGWGVGLHTRILS